MSFTTRFKLNEPDALDATIATVWGRVRQLSTKTAVASASPVATHAVTMRFRSDLAADDEIVYRGRVLRVLSVKDIDDRRAYLQAACAERGVDR